MPNGDATLLGSKGVILSGGQKQRLTIARAVYARKRIAIFDDIFSGLDIVTEHLVFSRVFGAAGLLRKTKTLVILATHGVNRLQEADHIVVLGMEGRVLEQGNFESLSKSGKNVQKHVQARKNQETKTGYEQSDTTSEDSPASARIPDILDAGRQTGDWRMYKYYGKSMGWLSLIVFGTCVASQTGFGILQCKSYDGSSPLGYADISSAVVELVV